MDKKINKLINKLTEKFMKILNDENILLFLDPIEQETLEEDLYESLETWITHIKERTIDCPYCKGNGILHTSTSETVECFCKGKKKITLEEYEKIWNELEGIK